jgi:signal transduction histidine kinase/DNA-binding response OmpR family regulator
MSREALAAESLSGEIWRVLIVDDSPEDRNEVRRLLLTGSDRRYRFTEAETGTAGIRLCLEAGAELPNCLVVDFSLPDMDALDLLAELRAGGEALPCPVVAITGQEGQATARAVLRAGAHTYIGKGWMTADSLTRGIECAVERFDRERKLSATRQILEQERARLQAILETLPTGVMVTDAAGRALLMNSALDAIWRGNRPLESKEQYGDYRAWNEAGEPVGPEDWPVSQVLGTGEPQGPREFRIERFDGTTGRIVVSAVPIKDATGSLVGATAAVEDITDQRRVEESLRHLREQAEEASRAKDEFVAVVSHELRTPLNAIAGWTQILRQRIAGDEMALRAVETIERNTKTQTQLIEDLLDMSRILSGKMRLEIQRIDPAMAVAAAIGTLRHAAEARGIALEVQIAAGLPELEADPARLQQILWNLISNAVKFTSAGARVEVLAEPAGASVRFIVKDTGKGISPDFLPYVFDRFRQAEGALARRHGGLGLGLSIVRHLVELHGGTVSAASEGEERGAVFTVEIPARSSRFQAAEWPAPGPPAELTYLDGARVLVADDDKDTRDAFVQLLRQCRAEVVAVDSGREAVELLRRGERFSCFVCDIGMPGMDGFTAIAEVRALETAASLPALAVTAFAAESDRTRAMTAGFDAFLAKPVSPAQLLSSIAALISAPPRRGEGPGIAGAFAPLGIIISSTFDRI